MENQGIQVKMKKYFKSFLILIFIIFSMVGGNYTYATGNTILSAKQLSDSDQYVAGTNGAMQTVSNSLTGTLSSISFEVDTVHEDTTDYYAFIEECNDSNFGICDRYHFYQNNNLNFKISMVGKHVFSLDMSHLLLWRSTNWGQGEVVDNLELKPEKYYRIAFQRNSPGIGNPDLIVYGDSNNQWNTGSCSQYCPNVNWDVYFKIEVKNSLTFTCGTSTVNDSDGNSYGTTEVNGQCWMKENMRVGKMLSGALDQTNNAVVEKYCYDNNLANCYTDGGLYQWDEAMQYSTTEGAQGICPVGWHIPTDGEQFNLENYLKNPGAICDANRPTQGECDGAGARMKSGTPPGLNFPMTGHRITDGLFFALRGVSAVLWSSSQIGSEAWYRYVTSYESNIYRYKYPKNIGFSIRCIQDSSSLPVVNHKPVIRPIEPNPLTITQGSFYIFPSAIADDLEDGEITNIKGTGSVDTLTVGTYKYKYNIKDSSGLAADEVILTVNVVAKSINHAPTLTFPSAPFNDGIDPNTGMKDSTKFTFKVIYTDIDDDKPFDVTLHFRGINWGEWNTGALIEDTSGTGVLFNDKYDDGEMFTLGIDALEQANTYEYYFTTDDSHGEQFRNPVSGVLNFEVMNVETLRNELISELELYKTKLSSKIKLDIYNTSTDLSSARSINWSLWGKNFFSPILFSIETSLNGVKGIKDFIKNPNLLDGSLLLGSLALSYSSFDEQVNNFTKGVFGTFYSESITDIVTRADDRAIGICFTVLCFNENKFRSYVYDELMSPLDSDSKIMLVPRVLPNEQRSHGHPFFGASEVELSGIELLDALIQSIQNSKTLDINSLKSSIEHVKFMRTSLSTNKGLNKEYPAVITQGNQTKAITYLNQIGAINQYNSTFIYANDNLNKSLTLEMGTQLLDAEGAIYSAITFNAPGLPIDTKISIATLGSQLLTNGAQDTYKVDHKRAEDVVTELPETMILTLPFELANTRTMTADMVNTVGLNLDFNFDSNFFNTKPGNMIQTVTYSAVDLVVVDKEGRKSGHTNSGQVLEEIPESKVLGTSIFIKNPSQGLRYLLVGKENGPYTWKLTKYINNLNEDISIREALITQGDTHEVVVNGDFLSTQGKNSFEINIDKNSDGKIDKIVQSEGNFSDIVAPTTTSTITGSLLNNGWYNGSTNIKLTATDNITGVGVKETKYSLNNGTSWNTYSGSINVSKEGINTIQFYSIDWFGNKESTKTQYIKIDKTSPEGKVSPSTNKVDIEVTGTDNLSKVTVTKVNENNYTLTDEAGNTTKIVINKEKLKGKSKKYYSKASYKIVSVQYKNEKLIKIANNDLTFEWYIYNKQYNLLNQYIELYGKFEIEAEYKIKKNQTNILIRTTGKPKKETLNGLKITRFETKNGVLQYGY